MFHDDSSKMIRKIEEILKDHDFEEVLEDNDVTVAEAIYYLYTSGYLDLPEVNPITVDLEYTEGNEE